MYQYWELKSYQFFDILHVYGFNNTDYLGPEAEKKMFAFVCVYEWIATNMDSQQDPVY